MTKRLGAQAEGSVGYIRLIQHAAQPEASLRQQGFIRTDAVLTGQLPEHFGFKQTAIQQTAVETGQASGIAVASLTDVNLCAQSERSEVFRFIFSELQQALPYLPNEHSANAGVYEGRITQPVINFLLAKLAFNAEIYTFDDWTRGYKKRPKGKKIHFVVQTADGASLLNGGTAGENRSKELNAWETCIFYCDKLAAEGYGLEENEIFNSSTYARLLRENGGSHLVETEHLKPLFRFCYPEVLLMKEKAKVCKGDKASILFPIPQKCLDLNPKLVQNKGYEKK